MENEQNGTTKGGSVYITVDKVFQSRTCQHERYG